MNSGPNRAGRELCLPSAARPAAPPPAPTARHRPASPLRLTLAPGSPAAMDVRSQVTGDLIGRDAGEVGTGDRPHHHANQLLDTAPPLCALQCSLPGALRLTCAPGDLNPTLQLSTTA